MELTKKFSFYVAIAIVAFAILVVLLYLVLRDTNYCNSDESGTPCRTILPTKDCRLVLQDDGNLVIYKNSDNSVIWASQSANKGTGPYQLILQNDGNLVVYDATKKPVWASDTVGKGIAPYHLSVTPDCKAVVLDSKGMVVFST